jgi:hypothetical protein
LDRVRAASDKKFPEGSLDEIFLEALKTERIDFVRLLLLNGVSIEEFLSPSRLRELYSHTVSEQWPVFLQILRWGGGGGDLLCVTTKLTPFFSPTVCVNKLIMISRFACK